MRRRSVIPAICAVLILVVGQLVAFVHHATERHVTCSEHGDERDAVELVELLHANCDHDHWIAVDGDSDGGHDDCPMQRLLRQSSAAAHGWIAPVLVAVVTRVASPPPVERAAVHAVYRIAPKTSPPA